MKLRLETAVLALPLLGLAGVGCGGTQQEDSYSAAMPNSESMAMELDGLDESNSQALTIESPETVTLPADPCHPHLFRRTSNVVHALNGLINPIMKRVDAALVKDTSSAVGKSRRWLRTSGEEDLRVTVTHTTTSDYTYELDVKAKGAADSTYKAVITGSVTEDASTPGAYTGKLHIDLSMLGVVNPNEKATGLVDVSYALANGTKTLVIDLKDYAPNDTSATNVPPRQGHYVYAHTLGVGGTLKFMESVALLCPSNPDKKTADLKTVSRWFHSDAQTVVGRSDSMASGGQIPQGDKWMGLTCSQRAASEPTTVSAERYWQMKLEGPDGTTLRGDSTYSARDSVNPASTCDAAFGAVPSFDNSTGDFDFSKVDFTDSTPLPIPSK